MMIPNCGFSVSFLIRVVFTHEPEFKVNRHCGIVCVTNRLSNRHEGQVYLNYLECDELK